MADPIARMFADAMGYNPNFIGDLPRTTYTTAGAISPTDRFSLINSASALAMTLAAGPRDGCPLIVKNIGAGTLTLTATIDGTAGATAVNSLGALRLIWSNANNTWLSI